MMDYHYVQDFLSWWHMEMDVHLLHGVYNCFSITISTSYFSHCCDPTDQKHCKEEIVYPALQLKGDIPS